MNRRTKLALSATVAILIVSLVGLSSPAWMPLLPAQVQQTLGGSIHTNPGTADEMFRVTRTGPYRPPAGIDVTHEDVDAEYRLAAGIWPWKLPPGWSFPRTRGVPDTPGHHWAGMGVRAAFSTWASATLDAVRNPRVTDAEKNALLDALQEGYRALYAERLLTDASFGSTIDRLRP